jgi:hypothetical protein
MDPILDKSRAQQNVLERIMNAIPGFKGYREKELRRDADKAHREHLASLLEEAKKPLNQISTDLSRSGNLGALNDVETARKRLDKVIARIRWADRGYAGFFDTVKVDEAMLGRVYEFDLALLEGVDRIRAVASGASLSPAAGTTPPGDDALRVRTMIEEINALDARLADREAILSGVR